MKNFITIKDHKIMIDPEDYDQVTAESWYIQEGGKIRSSKLRTFLHKFILGITEPGTTAYHINGNSWDNRKKNLVECTVPEATAYMKTQKGRRNAAEASNAFLNDEIEMWLNFYITDVLCKDWQTPAAVEVKNEIYNIMYARSGHKQKHEMFKAISDEDNLKNHPEAQRMVDEGEYPCIKDGRVMTIKEYFQAPVTFL